MYYLWMVNILLLCFLEFYAKHKSNRARFNLDCSSYYCLEFFYGTKFTMFYMRVNSLWFILKVFFPFYEKFMCGMETTELERLLTFSFFSRVNIKLLSILPNKKVVENQPNLSFGSSFVWWQYVSTLLSKYENSASCLL